MKFSKGKIVMALEGGYNLNSLAKSVLACIEVLLEDNPIAESYEVYPFESTWRVIKDVRLCTH
jgi:histone deacetylase 4/5